MYVTKQYRARPLAEVFANIDAGARDQPLDHKRFSIGIRSEIAELRNQRPVCLLVRPDLGQFS